MINHISIFIHLFNLLIPTEISQSLEQQVEVHPLQYEIVDLSTDSHFDPFLKRIPTIASNFFLSKNASNSDEDFDCADDNGLFCFLNLSSTQLLGKMKAVLSLAREIKLGPIHVSGMNIALLRIIRFSLQRAIIDCEESKIVTPKFCFFLQNIFSILSVSFSEQISRKFFSLQEMKWNSCDLIIRLTLSNLLLCVLHQIPDHNFVLFCLKNSKVLETQQYANLLILKIFPYTRFHLIPNVIETFPNSLNAFTELIFLNEMHSVKNIYSFTEYQKLKKIFKDIIENGQYIISTKENIMYISKNKQKNVLEGLDKTVTTALETKIMQNAFDLVSSSKDFHQTMHLVFAFSLTPFFKDHNFASFLNYSVLNFVQYSQSIDHETKIFEISYYYYALPFAQFLLKRMLLHGYNDLADKLFSEMHESIKNDQCVLHWVSLFLVDNFHLITETISLGLYDILRSLPLADKFFIVGEDFAFRISQLLLEKELPLIRDPSLLEREYTSEYEHAYAFALCSFTLSSKDPTRIAEALLSPIADLKVAWPNRDRCLYTFARIATDLHPSIGAVFFKRLVSSQIDMAMVSGKIFMMFCGFRTFAGLCEKIENLTERDPKKLVSFLRMLCPSFKRLVGNEMFAVKLMCSIIGLASIINEISELETVIDVVCLLCSKLKIAKYRNELLGAAQALPKRERELMEAAMDIEAESY